MKLVEKLLIVFVLSTVFLFSCASNKKEDIDSVIETADSLINENDTIENIEDRVNDELPLITEDNLIDDTLPLQDELPLTTEDSLIDDILPLQDDVEYFENNSVFDEPEMIINPDLSSVIDIEDTVTDQTLLESNEILPEINENEILPDNDASSPSAVDEVAKNVNELQTSVGELKNSVETLKNDLDSVKEDLSSLIKEDSQPSITETLPLPTNEALPVPTTETLQPSTNEVLPSSSINTTDENLNDFVPSVIIKDSEPSRTMNAQLNQVIDVIYPGTGWIFLGDELDSNVLSFSGRALNNGNTYFTFRAKTVGKALLQFFKQDLLTGNDIIDYLEVNVINENSDETRLSAPSYTPSSIREEPITINPPATQNLQEANVIENSSNVSQSDIVISDEIEDDLYTNIIEDEPAVMSVVQSDSSPETLYLQAEESFNYNEFEAALGYINQYLETALTDFDKGLFLKGQILEAKSSVRNMKESLASYTQLVDSYPDSTFWQRAKDRITYIQRFYFAIR